MSTPAGWYPDTEVAGGERWWDGTQWSHQRRPKAATKAAAGWYPDPEMVQTQRYWDGAEWTSHRAPTAASAAQQNPTTSPVGDYTALDALGILTAIFLPIVGLLIGLFLIGKSATSSWIIGLAVVSFFGYLYLFNAGSL